MAKSQKVVATSANLALLAAAASKMFSAPSQRGGKAERPLDDGTTYDDLAEQLIQLGPGQTLALFEGEHFSTSGIRLTSVESRIRKALADSDRRDALHRLTAEHITVKAIEGQKGVKVQNPETGKMESVDLPNCVVIGTHPGIAGKYDDLAAERGWPEREEESEELEAVG